MTNTMSVVFPMQVYRAMINDTCCKDSVVDAIRARCIILNDLEESLH